MTKESNDYYLQLTLGIILTVLYVSLFATWAVLKGSIYENEEKYYPYSHGKRVSVEVGNYETGFCFYTIDDATKFAEKYEDKHRVKYSPFLRSE